MLDRPLLDHADIAARIPHAGSMCLLGAVTFWDAHRIVCLAISHRAADHPLRAADGSLGVAAGIEYAAQAMAVHGSLLTEQAARRDGSVAPKPSPGMLASVRAVEMHTRRLDDLEQALQVEATRVASDAQALVYSFELFVLSAPADPARVDPLPQSGDTAVRTSPIHVPPNQVLRPVDDDAPLNDGRSVPDRLLLLSGRASVMLLPRPH